LKIALCDDNKADLLRLVTLLDAYRHVRKLELSYKCFQNALDLIASMESLEYDLILLDVLMPGINGIQAAREIRQADNRMEIIFLTTSPEFAVDSYSVRAYYYILKPATEEKLFPILDRLINNSRKPDDSLVIKTQSSVLSLPFSKIEYVEVQLKRLYFYLTDGSIREVTASLNEYEHALLKRPGFIKVHRSCLVNLKWVQELRQNELITLMGRRVPVSRSAYPRLRTAFTQFLFVETEELFKNEGGGFV
jgi:DNA-binding LytR/AlgR family response regulator